MISFLKFLRFLGPLTLFFATFVILPPLSMQAFASEVEMIFLSIFISCLIYGILIEITLRRKKFIYTPRDGFLITFFGWVFISILASLPFFFSGMNYADSIFEAVSGLTTTGSTTISNLSSLSDSLLIYRQLLQWAGGVGLIIVVLAIIPAASGGIRILQAETSGFADNSFSPRLKKTARSLLRFYLGITILCAISYWLAGMNYFEAISHSFSTVSIGGFSIYDDNFGHFNSPLIEGIAILFILISATNFGLHFLFLLKKDIKFYVNNDEFKFFLLLILTVTTFSVLVLLFNEKIGLSESFRYGIFQTISIITTTGFTITELDNMGILLPILIMLLAYVGACSGSVGGGIKAWRINILIRLAFDNITKIMHPTAVSTIKFNGEKIEQKQIESVFSFVTIYILISILFLLVLMLQNIDFYSAFSAVSATLNNLGPGLGQFSDNYSSLEPAGKITLSLAMIIGRLEIFGFLLLLFPSFWRN